VGGFPTEVAAKAARDEARVSARRGEHVDRSAITVTTYLREWQISHSVAVKPKTMAGYRELAERYVIPRIGGMRLQSVRPATVSRLYRDLLAGGGLAGKPLPPRTVEMVHRMLSKAFRDAVRVEQLIPSSPVERATRPRVQSTEPKVIWSTAQLRAFLAVAAAHRLGSFYRLAAYTGARRGELLHLRWTALDLDAAEVTFTADAETRCHIRAFARTTSRPATSPRHNSATGRSACTRRAGAPGPCGCEHHPQGLCPRVA
jgi:integrase